MIEKELHLDLLKKVLSRGGEYADIFIESRKMTSLVIEDSRLEKIISGTEAGAGIRLLLKGKTSYAYSNDLSPRALLQSASDASRMASDMPAKTIASLAARNPAVQFGIQQCRRAYRLKKRSLLSETPKRSPGPLISASGRSRSYTEIPSRMFRQQPLTVSLLMINGSIRCSWFRSLQAPMA